MAKKKKQKEKKELKEQEVQSKQPRTYVRGLNPMQASLVRLRRNPLYLRTYVRRIAVVY